MFERGLESEPVGGEILFFFFFFFFFFGGGGGWVNEFQAHYFYFKINIISKSTTAFVLTRI